MAIRKICELPESLWERACSRWRCVRRCGCWMCRPHREQARSHRFNGYTQNLRTTRIIVGASLLAMVVCQAMWMLDVPASSRASSLPQVQWLYAKSANYPNHRGSELARDGGVSGDVDAGCAGLIASKLAPTGSMAIRKICELPKSLWERACSRWWGVRRSRCWMCRPHREQARSHRFNGYTQNLRTTRIIVGASLLAMAVCQAMWMLDVLASSRASSLLQDSRFEVLQMTEQLCGF